MSEGRSRRLAERYLWFALGVAVNSFGIALITKANLGTSPISSVPYVLDLATPLTFGETTFLANTLYVALQAALLRRDFKPVQLLQLVVNLAFSALIDVSMGLLSWLDPQGLPACLASLLTGCCALGFGVALEVAPNVVVVPGEGMVRAISAVTRRPFGRCKVAFDVSLVALACATSFALFGGLEGLGAGTVVSALLVGRVCGLCNRRLPLLARVAALSRDPSGAPDEMV